MEVIEQIKDILKRIDRLEQVVFVQKTKVSDAKTNITNGSLPDRILALRKAGFFKQQKTAQEVHMKLQSTYPCDFNRVEVALLRLLKRKLLRITSKTVNGKNLRAYVW